MSGNTVVETAELLRVFGALKSDGGTATVAQHAAPAAENSSMQHVLEVTLELLKGQLKASQEREEKLLDMLRQEQQARWSLEQRLLPPGTEKSAPEPEPAATGDSAAPSGGPPDAARPDPVAVQATPVSVSPSPAGPETEKKGRSASVFQTPRARSVLLFRANPCSEQR